MTSKTESDVSPEHFDWLVSRRSENQTSTLNIYTILKKNEKKINRNPILYDIAQTLTGIAFSLWRSVFLSDVTKAVEKGFTDLNRFLVSLIGDNIVLYQTDKNARNWSFVYYLENAEFRLASLSKKYPKVLAPKHVKLAAKSEKQRWENAQLTLNMAISGFESMVDSISASTP